jgi:AcrR family transcriptional regulator
MLVKVTTNGGLDAAAILEILEAAHADEQVVPTEGLRDRKKRRQRQRISNVATASFLTEGFDNVSVARIAAACEVSQQTVFNYFPTKESMFFDRSESSAAALAETIRNRGSEPLTQVVVDALLSGAPAQRWGQLQEVHTLELFRLFCRVAENSPTLRAAPYVELPEFIATIGAALAERGGADPDDPEVELTAMLIAGLMQVRTQASFRHVHNIRSVAALENAVRADFLRALRIATPALEAFDKLGP